MISDDLPPGIVSAAGGASTERTRPESERAPDPPEPPEPGEQGTTRITAIEPQARRQGRVNVFVDGKFALGLFEEVAHALGLHIGQPITEERLLEITRAETLRRAKEDAYRLLSFRARAEKEIADRLERKGYEEDVVAEVTASLRAHGYVDDAAFAEGWVAARGKTRGRRALAHELRQKGVAGEVAEETLAAAKGDEAEREAAFAAAVKKAGQRPSDQSREAQGRLAAFLQRRGFGWDAIRPTLARLYGPVAAEDEAQEFDG